MSAINPIERHLFLKGIYLRYGYDFRGYAEASLDRRLQALMARQRCDSLVQLLHRILQSSSFFHQILPYLTVSTTEFFRDPLFFRTLRTHVYPLLKTYSRLQVWVAGCSTGEEILSLAITLKEEGLLRRTTIFATDVNPDHLKKAQSRIYELSALTHFNKHYVAAGGTGSPSDYYTADYGLIRFDPALLENTVFSQHNLATDGPFVEAHLILCRNVLIYFDRKLQDHVFDLFAHSLVFRGFLGLGAKESVRFSQMTPYFEDLHLEQRIYGLKALPVGRTSAPPYRSQRWNQR